MKCIFCNIISAKLPAFTVWENRDFLLLLDLKPINPSHLLFLPKKHVKDIFLLPPKKLAQAFLTIQKIVPIIKKVSRAKRIGIAIEGFGVPHAHIHLVPVNKGNDLNPERAKRASFPTLQKQQRKLKVQLKNIR